MLARLRSTLFAINASYWFYPALFSIAGFLLGLGMVYLDRAGAAELLNRVDWLHPSRPDGASNMLTVLAGSMIGVASTVFSITIAAVAYASGTYGPRLLTNFMEDKGNQLSLATFIGTFVYAITVLRTVRAEDESPASGTDAAATALPGFVPQLSLLTGFALMIVAVSVLVYFLHHIPSSIRINTVVEGIGRGLLRQIAERFPEEDEQAWPDLPSPEGAIIPALDTGYIRYIELGELADCAEERGLTIGLAVRTGDFVHPGKPIARIDRDAVDDEDAGAIRNCLALGGTRSPEQDLEFAIDELVEIALRALSPGINDPFTAITVTHWLGAATAELGRRALRQQFVDRDWEDGRVVPLDDDFAHFFARGFGAARGALASNRLTALVALDALRDAAATLADEDRRALLAREGSLLVRQAELALTGPELREVQDRHRAFRTALSV